MILFGIVHRSDRRRLGSVPQLHDLPDAREIICRQLDVTSRRSLHREETGNRIDGLTPAGSPRAPGRVKPGCLRLGHCLVSLRLLSKDPVEKIPRPDTGDTVGLHEGKQVVVGGDDESGLGGDGGHHHRIVVRIALHGLFHGDVLDRLRGPFQPLQPVDPIRIPPAALVLGNISQRLRPFGSKPRRAVGLEAAGSQQNQNLARLASAPPDAGHHHRAIENHARFRMHAAPS